MQMNGAMAKIEEMDFLFDWKRFLLNHEITTFNILNVITFSDILAIMMIFMIMSEMILRIMM